MGYKNAKHYGYVVGDKFRYRDDAEDSNKNEDLIGNVLILIEDDGTVCPRFATESGIEGYEELQLLHKINIKENKQIKPEDLSCWRQVASALGEERAAVELQKVIDTPAALLDRGAESVSVAFIWPCTPQGIDFWRYVEKGHYPDNTTKNEEKVTDEPVFGIVVRQYDIPEGCNGNVNHKEVTISFNGKYYYTKTEEGYDMVMQAIRLLAQAKNIERD